jgi:hypothetical protein
MLPRFVLALALVLFRAEFELSGKSSGRAEQKPATLPAGSTGECIDGVESG